MTGPRRGRAVYPIVFAVKHGSAAQLEWPNQFVLMYHGVICLYNRANYERFAFALLPRAVHQADDHAARSTSRSSSRSLPVSPARLLSDDPVDAAALFTLTRITITLVRLHIQLAETSRQNVDNDGATVIRGTSRTVRSDPIRTGPDRSGDRRANRHCIPANERHREHD